MRDIEQYLNALSADCTRGEWVYIGTAFKSAGGDFETFRQWSEKTTQHRYDAKDCRTTWESFAPSNNPDGAKGLLRKLAKEAGAVFSEPMPPRRNAPPMPLAVPPPPPPPRSATPRPSPEPTQFRIIPGFKSIQPGTPEIQDYITRCAANRTEAENYFCKERGLSAETVSAFQLGYDAADGVPVIPYPGELYCVRRALNIPPDGHGNKYENPAGGRKPIFNAAALAQDRRPIFILEGQIDALSIMDAGGMACTGQNEQTEFLRLAKGSPARRYICVADCDGNGTGDHKANKMKDALKEANLSAVVAVMPPGKHDVNDFLRQDGREPLAAWIAQQEAAVEADEAPRPMTLRELQEKIEQEGEKDPNELIKGRFLCKGGAGILAAETGCGKSAFIMQLALHWGAGLACFGFEPIRPLKILLIQAENDERDLQEEISGVCQGAANVELLAFPQIAAAMDAVRIITDATHSGDGFISMLDGVLAREADTDLVIIDPLFSFAGCDLSDQEKVSHFLRNQINPLLQKHRAAALFVHHMAKPNRAAIPNANFNTAYSYHGSAEIINWARFAVILERFKDRDGNKFFTLTVPKRGRRLNWEKETKFLRWSDRYIYWEELTTAPEMDPLQPAVTPEARAERRELEKQEKLIGDAERAAELLQPGESITATAFRRSIIGTLAITNKTRVDSILAVCIERRFVIEREPTKEEKTSPGVRRMIERPKEPEEPPEQPEFF